MLTKNVELRKMIFFSNFGFYQAMNTTISESMNKYKKLYTEIYSLQVITI